MNQPQVNLFEIIGKQTTELEVLKGQLQAALAQVEKLTPKKDKDSDKAK